jgi:hypothetical protein
MENFLMPFKRSKQRRQRSLMQNDTTRRCWLLWNGFNWRCNFDLGARALPSKVENTRPTTFFSTSSARLFTF